MSWLGDSQAVLVRKGEALIVMDPHKPEREVKISHTQTHKYTKYIYFKTLKMAALSFFEKSSIHHTVRCDQNEE